MVTNDKSPRDPTQLRSFDDNLWMRPATSAMSLSLVEVTGRFASGMQATFERWLQDPGSLCEGASAAAVSSRLCAYGKTLGYQHEHVEWDARSARQKLLNASKDTTVSSERGSKHFVTKLGGGVWAITTDPWMAPVVANTRLTPQPTRRPNSHLVTTTSDSRALKRRMLLSEKAKGGLIAAARHSRDQEDEIKVSGQCCVSPSSPSSNNTTILVSYVATAPLCSSRCQHQPKPRHRDRDGRAHGASRLQGASCR